jgi:hypothetical protein
MWKLTSTLLAVAQAICPDYYQLYDSESGMCEQDALLVDYYWCPGSQTWDQQENTLWDFISCPGLGCGNYDENWCCPSSDRQAW